MEERFKTQEEIKKMGIKLIKTLFELGFNEEEVQDILYTSTKHEAYRRVIEKRIAEKEKQ